MYRQRLRIAVTVTPDFRLRAVAADERIVARCGTVRRDADDFAEMVGEILRLVARAVVITERDEQVAVGCLRDPAAIMVAGRRRSLLPEDDLDVAQARLCAVVEFSARDRGAATTVHALGVAEIERRVVREISIERDIEQSALSGGPHLRHPADRRRQLAVARDDAQPSRPLRHQHPSVRQKGKAPGICQPTGDGLDFERAAGRGVE